MSVFGRRNQRGRIRPLNGATDVTIDFSKLSVGPYVTFTRAATSGTGQTGATYIDSAGQFQLAGANVARFHHSTAGSFLGLLSEEQRANVALQSAWAGSDNIGDPPTGWTHPHATGTSVSVASAYGSADGASAISQVATGGTQRPYLNQQFTLAAGVSYMFSFYIEAIGGGLTYSNIFLLSGIGTGTVTGTVSYFLDGAGVSAGDTAAVGRLSVRFDCASITTGATGFRAGIGPASPANGTITISRPQVEVCSATCQSASSYIPTVGAAITRPADYATLDMALPSVNATVGKLQGTVVVRYQLGTHGTANRVPLSFSDGAHSNMTIGEHATASATHSIVNDYETLDRTTGIAGLNKAAFSYGTPSLSAYAISYSLNGSAAVTGNTDIDMNALTVVPIGRDGSSTVGGSDWLNGGVRDIVFYPDRKTDAQLILL